MKLKKIASLALAGVMAVSMLAGCSNGSSNSNNGENGNVSSIVAAVNNGQDSYNKVKVNFTTDSKLESAAKTALGMYGEAVDENNLEDAMIQYAQILNPVTTLAGNFYSNEKGTTLKTTAPKDGESVIYFDVIDLGPSGTSEDFRMNAAAKSVNALVSLLDDTTLVTEEDVKNGNATTATADGAKYYDFSYVGHVCLISAPSVSGSTNYYMAVYLEQTAAEKTQG